MNQIPISEGIDPPAERLPEPVWIPITREERERMFPCVNAVEETVVYVEDIDTSISQSQLLKSMYEKLLTKMGVDSKK